MTEADKLATTIRASIVRMQEKISHLEDVIAKIQHTNLRRDMNIETRTKEIDRLCKGEKK